MVLLRLRQYSIDVHCVNDSPEDVGRDSRVAGDGICRVAFDSMCICVKRLWMDRSAVQNDVYLYHVMRYGAKVLG